MKTKRILALDTGISCGYAISTADGEDLVDYGAVKFLLNKQQTKNLPQYMGQADRWDRFLRWLDGLANCYTFDGVAFEDSFVGKSRRACELKYGWETILKLWALKYNLPVAKVAPTSLKKWATGDGRCGKDAMIAKANLHWDVTLDEHEDDVADALMVLAWSLSEDVEWSHEK